MKEQFERPLVPCRLLGPERTWSRAGQIFRSHQAKRAASNWATGASRRAGCESSASDVRKSASDVRKSDRCQGQSGVDRLPFFGGFIFGLDLVFPNFKELFGKSRPPFSSEMDIPRLKKAMITGGQMGYSRS